MSSEKRFPPTSRRLSKAAREGDVARSSELTSAVQLIACNCVIIWTVSDLARQPLFLDKNTAPTQDFLTKDMLLFCDFYGLRLVRLLGTYFAACVLTSVAGQVFQTGFRISFSGLKLDFSKLNLLSGVRRIFWGENPDATVPRALITNVVKSVFCLVLLAATFVWLCLTTVELLQGIEIEHGGLGILSTEAMRKIGLVLGGILGGGVASYELVRRERFQRLRMTLEEFREELKESEGNAETKAERRALFQELAYHGSVESVRRACFLLVGKGTRSPERKAGEKCRMEEYS